MANLAAMKAAQQAKKVKGAGDVIADGIASGIMGAASSVLGRAASQLGVPYVWGGMNPEGNRGGSGEGFDCSGFTSWAYKPTGTTLPHSAAMQLDMTKKSGTLTNRTSQLQPGMLVFFNFGRLAQGVADHVGIYVGNGMVMDASSSNNAIVKRKLSELTGAGTFLGGGFPNKPSKAQVIGRRS
jgi:cell wall-associated NlpC family hydrolase